ncbi:MAG TPA: (d)CMP kinase [Mycobacteriales bacterium]|nr:(d)CMP kinase [Mycobacteriales bacterium]
MVEPIPLDRLVVAIDGPSGSGKSTVARRVAQRLRLRYLDTGSMYRAVAWAVLDRGVDPRDAELVAELATGVRLVVGTSARRPTVAVDDQDVTIPIRSREVTNAVSAVAAVPQVRRQLVAVQRTLIGGGGIVVEGRDIGTAVAPEAAVKVFLTASEEARAERRHRQVAREEPTLGMTVTHAELIRRDHKDSTRDISPLVCAPDAICVDSTELGVGDVVAAVLDRCRAVGVVVPTPRRPRAGR